MVADDICLMYVNVGVDALVLYVNEKFPLVLEWFILNTYSLYHDKSEFTINTHKQIKSFPIVYLRDTLIKRLESVMYLGFNIDDRLICHTHVQQAKNKQCQFSFFSYKLKNYFDLQESRDYYFACVYPNIVYCIESLVGALHLTATGRKLIEFYANNVENLIHKFLLQVNVC